jgi:hypothetical protein
MRFFDVDDFVEMFPNEKATETKLMDLGVLKKEMNCRKCGCQMKMIEKRDKFVFRCGMNACGRIDFSIGDGTIFSGSRLSCRDIMKIARAWIQGEGANAAVRSANVNKNTVTLWFSAFRELIASSLKDSERKIGGPGVIVQID